MHILSSNRLVYHLSWLDHMYVPGQTGEWKLHQEREYSKTGCFTFLDVFTRPLYRIIIHNHNCHSSNEFDFKLLSTELSGHARTKMNSDKIFQSHVNDLNFGVSLVKAHASARHCARNLLCNFRKLFWNTTARVKSGTYLPGFTLKSRC